MKGRRPSMTSVGRRLARPASRSVALALAALLVSGCATTKVDRSSDAAIVERVLTLIKQRLDVAPAVARAKWNSRASIEDPVREQQVIEAVAIQAAAHGIDRAVAERFFRGQIEASKVVQRALHADWTDRRQEPFPTVASLDRDIRPVLDRLTPEMLRSLAAVVPVLRRPDGRVQLARRSQTIVTSTPGSREAVRVAVGPLLAVDSAGRQ